MYVLAITTNNRNNNTDVSRGNRKEITSARPRSSSSSLLLLTTIEIDRNVRFNEKLTHSVRLFRRIVSPDTHTHTHTPRTRGTTVLTAKTRRGRWKTHDRSSGNANFARLTVGAAVATVIVVSAYAPASGLAIILKRAQSCRANVKL